MNYFQATITGVKRPGLPAYLVDLGVQIIRVEHCYTDITGTSLYLIEEHYLQVISKGGELITITGEARTTLKDAFADLKALLTDYTAKPQAQIENDLNYSQGYLLHHLTHSCAVWHSWNMPTGEDFRFGFPSQLFYEGPRECFE